MATITYTVEVPIAFEESFLEYVTQNNIVAKKSEMNDNIELEEEEKEEEVEEELKVDTLATDMKEWFTNKKIEL